jgi:predicted ATP-grasp superfamily ATP-dependent carboligase
MLKISDTSTPVLVLRAESHGGLNILRSLGRLGVPIYILDGNPWAPSFASRYCRRHFLWDIESKPAEESLAYLIEISRIIGRPAILIPTTDYASMFVAEYGPTLKYWYLFPEQQSELVFVLCSKKGMYGLARQHGIPTPGASFPTSRDDVLRFLRSARFPVMLKGIDGQRLWNRTRKKMVITHTPAELLEKYDAFEDPENPNLMLQEYIPGGEDSVWMFNGYFDEASNCLVGFTGKKIRQCPVHVGCTSLGVCLPNSQVESVTKTFMKAIDYRGILDIGYRYDARDHQYKVLDVNPRIGATFRLFVDENGMDVARALYLHLTGQPVSVSRPVYGRKWIVEDLDFVSSLRYHREGQLTLVQWLRSLRGIDEAAFFASDDLLPLVPMCLRRAGELFRRIGQKLAIVAPTTPRPFPSGSEPVGAARLEESCLCSAGVPQVHLENKQTQLSRHI